MKLRLNYFRFSDFCRLHVLFHLHWQVTVEGCGIYDNVGHGVQVEGEVTVLNCDILCNQRHAVSAEGAACIQVCKHS